MPDYFSQNCLVRGERIVAEEGGGGEKDLKRTWRKGKESVLLLEKCLFLKENQNSMYLFSLQIARIPTSLINPEL